ncbi:MAG: hypothetical protein WBO34_10025 [Gammaproteobacteria bacterium]
MRCSEILSPAVLGLALFAGQLLAGEPVLTDPTRPWNTHGYDQRQTPGNGSLTLSSTLVSRDRRVAVINGHHVSEGETIGNAIVVEIRKNDVVLQSPHRLITLKLLPDILKTQP